MQAKKWIAGAVVTLGLGALAIGAPRTQAQGGYTTLGVQNVIVISIDTLRADHLGPYGNTRVKTPNFDKLAAESIVFENAFSAAPTTLPSHTSLMTGSYPHTHGVSKNGDMVHPDNQMLAEALLEGGFKTLGVSGAFPLNQKFAFDQGFETYHSNVGDNAEVTDAVLKRTPQRAGSRMFLFIHYWDVHWPYAPPAPFDTLYREDLMGLVGSMDELKEIRAGMHRGEADAFARSEVMKDLYAGEVSWTDQQIGRLLEGLDKQGLLDKSMLIITSDHGEAFDEHKDYWDHGPTTYNSVTHVPLIIRLPGGKGGGTRVSSLVSNIDVMPSILEVLNLSTAPRSEGVSFAPAFMGQSLPPRTAIYSEATKPEKPEYEDGQDWPNTLKCKGVWTASWKYQSCPKIKMRELYTRADETEQKDQLKAQAGVSAQLEKSVQTWVATGDPLQGGKDESQDTIDALKALGYME
ncbi:MAG: arylsulfatase A-like enzyme [Cognaticolwellia sp.]|jgi:arylsulfatase A-like enzyme